MENVVFAEFSHKPFGITLAPLKNNNNITVLFDIEYDTQQPQLKNCKYFILYAIDDTVVYDIRTFESIIAQITSNLKDKLKIYFVPFENVEQIKDKFKDKNNQKIVGKESIEKDKDEEKEIAVKEDDNEERSSVSESFEDLVKRANLIYSPSIKMKSIKPLKNPHAIYNACFEPDKQDPEFQVRYTIYPKWSSGKFFAQICLGTFVANISQNMDTVSVTNGFKSFPEQSVKKEFNADYGFTAKCDIDHQWSTVYDKAIINAIGIENGVFVIICILFKEEFRKSNKMLFRNTVTSAFHDLIFIKR
eukprot:528650_1